MKKTKYATATAFRRALEDRLKNIEEKEKTGLPRLRRQVAFDRLLARLFLGENSPWVLKGGYAMELRMANSRATRDIDLILKKKIAGSPNNAEQNNIILGLLREKADADLSDFFVYRIETASIDLTNAPYGGGRFPVIARMDGRTFAKFHLDVGLGDVVLEPLEVISGRDWLGFAGISPPRLTALSKEQQFAEKLHAYTTRRERTNSRVRDLVDMVLLIDSGELSGVATLKAIQRTFGRRKTHSIPENLPQPPENWRTPFVVLAEQCQLPTDISRSFAKVGNFYSNLLKKDRG
ncbi:MAG: nucleotidyl transferase AbiEii/AbiGii toxin family protein [Deltaproteobacteria bacterium]|nr:nucleotidyl transferase AbiEii/AbiGii toxin family protein [Deltaproteobacteria bacterium]